MPDIERGIRTVKGWLLRATQKSSVQESPSTRGAGERRYGLDDRRGPPRLNASDRRDGQPGVG
ncbi:MAG TPA: hypothetical protein VF651_10365 [Gammaproteobacteria bacterium]